MISKLLYRLFKKGIDRAIFEAQSMAIGKDNMEYRFTDSKGIRYWHWPNLTGVNFMRKEYIKKCMIEYESGLPGIDLNYFVESGLKASREYDAARQGWLWMEMENRRDGVVVPDTAFALIAATHIREDADPFVWDITEEKRKIEQFKEDSKTGLRDFFLKTSLIKLYPYLDISEAELITLLTSGEAKSEGTRETLKQYLQQPSGKTKSDL